MHPEVFVELEKNEKNRISNKRKASEMSSSSQDQTIAECFTRRIDTYQCSSTEYKARETALVDFFIDTGYPATMVDNEKFREFCTSMDPKFKPPGVLYCSLIIVSILVHFVA